MKLTYYFCFFLVLLIDFFILVKYLIMFIEKAIYAEDYPIIVTLDISLKGSLQLSLFIIEWILVLKKQLFNYCKVAYAVKFLMILIVFFQSFCFTGTLQE